jgi:hypothetical protein
VKLAPGESVTHTEHWGVFDGLKKPSTDATFAVLAATVGKWIKTLK